MATIGFGICLIISILVLIFMAAKNYENINIYDWTIVILIPIIILGYWLKSRVTTPEAAELAVCFIYLDSTVLLMVAIFAMLHSFGVRLKAWIKLLGYGAALVHAFIVWISFGTGLYYSSVKVTITDAGTVAKMTPGPLKIIHVVYLIVVLLVILGILVVAHIKNGTHSRRILYHYSVVEAAFIIVYAVESFMNIRFSWLPYLYVLSVMIIAMNYDRMHMHDISSIISQQQKYYSRRGYVVLDRQQRFMSCNEKVFEFMPSLKMQRVDEKLPEDELLFKEMIEQFQNEGTVARKFKAGAMTCICEISELSLRRDGRIQGYIFDIRDATEEQSALKVSL